MFSPTAATLAKWRFRIWDPVGLNIQTTSSLASWASWVGLRIPSLRYLFKEIFGGGVGPVLSGVTGCSRDRKLRDS